LLLKYGFQGYGIDEVCLEKSGKVAKDVDAALASGSVHVGAS
jgi:hypothetical protein